MDVDDDEAVQAGVAEIVERHGRIDALVLAAGWGIAGAVEHTPMEDAKAQLETNFFGVVRVTQAALPHMRSQRGGRIVIVSSIGGAIGIPFQSFYSASKFALEGWADVGWRRELLRQVRGAAGDRDPAAGAETPGRARGPKLGTRGRIRGGAEPRGPGPGRAGFRLG
jgi:NAD(P)-dependent dehydrogenase (short-subunit alcohol dehydrogenase family)